MVLEVALIDVTESAEADFEAGYRAARQVLVEAPGSLNVTMRHGVETPTRFILMIEWESIQAHEQFRASPAFAVWREAVGSYFAGAPRVEHFLEVT